MVTMRAEGATYDEIAQEFGCTRQYVQQEICKMMSGMPCRTKSSNFPLLCKWMRKNRIKTAQLAEMAGIKYASFCRKMNNTGDFRMHEIKKILEITGMSFEEAFSEPSLQHTKRT